jgi:hypothetical protein
MILKINDYCTQFSGNKDIVNILISEKIRPYVSTQLSPIIILDFENVDPEIVTFQSFIHDLIGKLFQEYGDTAFEYLELENYNDSIKSIVITVIDNFSE